MNKFNRKNIITLIIILLLLAITTGISFAFFSYVKEGSTENSVKLGSITFIYTENQELGNGIMITDAFPISDAEGKALIESGKFFDFKVESNLSRSDLEYEVVAEPTDNSTLPLEAIKFYLTDITDGTEKEIESTLRSDNSVKTLNEFNNTQIENTKGKTIYQETISKNTKGYLKKFRARMWIDKDIDWSDDKYINKIGTIIINVYANSNKNIASNDTTLNDLTISSGTLSPAFQSGITSYTTIVPYSVISITVTPTVNDSEATYEVTGNTGFVVGENIVAIKVTAQNGSTKTYKIIVTRSKDTENTLKSLAVTGYSISPTFASDTTSYTLTLEASSVEVTASATSSVATVSGTGTQILNWGSNTVSVIVTAQDGTIKTYVITITNQRPTAPTITGGSDSWVATAPTISVSKAGTAISGVKHYEYYKSTSSTAPTDSTTATGTTSGSLTVSDEGTYYTWYRTVSNNGFKSVWTGPQVTNLDTIKPTIIAYGPTVGLNNDPMFTAGTNGIIVYNNLENGNVTITRESMLTNFGTSNALTITTNGAASPDLGGFCQWTTGNELNDVYVHYFIAKIPIGYKLLATANYLGEGARMRWLSDNKGTGTWQSYAYVIEMGSSYNSISTALGSFGHVYLTDGSEPVTWYLSYATMNKVNTSGTGDTFWFDFSDNVGIESYQITTSSTQPSTEWQSTSNLSFINHSASSGTYYLWVKDIAGNTSYKEYTFN